MGLSAGYVKHDDIFDTGIRAWGNFVIIMKG